MQALVSLATNASFGFSYTNFAKLRIELRFKYRYNVFAVKRLQSIHLKEVKKYAEIYRRSG